MRIVVPNSCLVILCGPAACGKSTFARRNFPATAVVSSDHCRAMIADDERDLRVSPDAFALFHQIIDLRLRYGRLAVADSTALHPAARRALRRIARRRQRPVVMIVFNVSEETCRLWDGRRERQVGAAVIHRQWQMLQEALARIPGEGYDQVVVLGEDEVGRAQVEVG
ncbi:MAG: AAA family ATPase [Armatimonadota bacterium]|nr:AAA family ATPase [Armatimonadota bacterium]MDR7450374.1 AAA family ATPase [Armatimonadota bacterium]MDR7467043.1 AAA family ATPase [Armatimonadota bacterium]MDR7493415.1 AAA family ATPase [Armatimonadota bacterium]MDR7498680.1 AAA family ATPase [Armatimonadota bacterium]